MKVIFVSGLFPIEKLKEIEKKSSGVIQYAADTLQWAIVNGLDFHIKKLKIVNLPFIGSFPVRYKDFKINSFFFYHNQESYNLNVGFVNLAVYKLYSRYFNVKKTLKNILQNENEVILIYAMHTPFIKAAVELKNKNPSVKICLIVPDLPEFMNDRRGLLFKFLKRAEKKMLDGLLKKIDCFVLLSDYMYEPLKIGNRPWIRVEGIFNSEENLEIVEKENHKTILYTGTLAKRYGILILLEAFSMIEDENYRLWVCGEGDAKEKLIEMEKIDSRISYFGQVSRKEVLSFQKKATVLVNPRTSEGEFTKFSFPSKTMEYLASGTPCIMNNLLGVPKEYFNYCFISKNETAIGLQETIISVCEKDQKELNEFGNKAKNFIIEKKSPKKQCEKIYNMLVKL